VNSWTVIGALITGVLLFASAILVPIITKRANKAEDASESAKRSAETAKLYTDSALALVGGVRQELADTKQKCDDCLGALQEMQDRAVKRDRSLDAVHSALLEIVPLLDADAESTRMLRSAIRTVAQARYED
jgi:hypothetical protein